jgi:hypothetical protein
MKRFGMAKKRRAGISWLELQAACAVFGIVLSGLAPFTVMYLKQVAAFEKRLNGATEYYLVPSSDTWARKLGSAATITSAATTSVHTPMPINAIQVLSFDGSFSGEDISVTVSVTSGS